MKKAISIILAALLFCGMLSAAAYAEGEPTIAVSSAEAKAGDTVSLTVSLANNPGIAALKMAINCNPELEVTSVKSGGLQGTWMTTLKGATWANTEDSSYNGIILTLEIKVSADAKPGEYGVNLSDISAYNYNVEKNNFVVVNGTITVKCDHDYISEVTTPATCGADGVMTYTCSRCNDTYTEKINATGEHSYGAWGNNTATCNDGGEQSRICSKCGDKETKTTSKLGHDYKSEVTTPATCGEDGVMTYTCSRCGEANTEAIKATGKHSYGEPIVDVEPGCETTGRQHRVCSVCEQEEAPTTIPSKGGHKWNKGEVTQKPTCTDPGKTLYTCTVCQKEEAEEIKELGHNWNKGEVTKEPTNTEPGQKTYTCKTCGATKTESIPVVAPDSKPKTGDEAALGLWAALLFASASGAALVLKKRKN